MQVQPCVPCGKWNNAPSRQVDQLAGCFISWLWLQERTGKHPLERLEWGEFEPPTQLTGAGAQEQIKELKKSDGDDIITFGSPTLVQSLANAGLVDEYRILIHPVIVNEGRRLFEKLDGRTDLLGLLCRRCQLGCPVSECRRRQ
jgi:riboflavin biosynthesis pyrimidine reductase